MTLPVIGFVIGFANTMWLHNALQAKHYIYGNLIVCKIGFANTMRLHNALLHLGGYICILLF